MLNTIRVIQRIHCCFTLKIAQSHSFTKKVGTILHRTVHKVKQLDENVLFQSRVAGRPSI